MTHWNYRIMRDECAGKHYYTIREVYHLNDGIGWTAGAASPYGDTRAELRADLLRMLDALDHPTLIDKDQP